MQEYLEWLNLVDKDASEEKIDAFLAGNFSTEISNIGCAEKPILLPGGDGALGHYTRMCKKGFVGHFEITYEILKKKNTLFSEEFLRNISRAARLSDLLFFDDLAYHAQTKHDVSYLPIEIEHCKKNSMQLLAKLTARAKEFYRILNIEEFIYVLGLALHLVQDISSHQGMTNPEHVFLDNIKKSPDLNEGFLELSKKLTIQYLNSNFESELSDETIVSYRNEISWKSFLFKKNPSILTNIFFVLPKSIKDYLKINLDEISEKHISRWFSYYDFPPEDLPKEIAKIFIELEGKK